VSISTLLIAIADITDVDQTCGPVDLINTTALDQGQLAIRQSSSLEVFKLHFILNLVDTVICNWISKPVDFVG
jgi:hypothetical protein